MKQLTIKVRAEDESDFDGALEQAQHLIYEGYHSGSQTNSFAAFQFKVTEDEFEIDDFHLSSEPTGLRLDHFQRKVVLSLPVNIDDRYEIAEVLDVHVSELPDTDYFSVEHDDVEFLKRIRDALEEYVMLSAIF